MDVSIDKIKVIDALRRIQDPISGEDLISKSMVENLLVEGNVIQFTLLLTPQHQPHKSNLMLACTQGVNRMYPDAEIHVHFKHNLAAPKADAGPVPQIKNIIAIASGKGGVGKSTISCNMAVALKEKGFKVGILDADLYGPSIPTMFGLQGQKPKIDQSSGTPKLVPIEKDGIHCISIGFVVEPEQAVVLRGPRLSGVIKQFIEDCVWPELDYLLIDLPPGTGDIQLTLVQSVGLTGVVMVTTPQEVAVVDAVKAMNMFMLPSVKVPILGVVENMAWFTPAELPDNKYFLFGEGGGARLAEMGQSELLGQVPIVQAVREGGDKGQPLVGEEGHPLRPIFMEIADKLLARVEHAKKYFGATQKVQVN